MNQNSVKLTHLFALLLGIVVSTQACTYGQTVYVETEKTGKVTQGRVLSSEDDSPIKNAFVIATWMKRYPQLGNYRDICFHVESTQTDENGYWQIHRESWPRMSPLPNPDRTATFTEFAIYKTGYVLPSRVGQMNPRKGNIYGEGFPRKYSVLMYDAEKWVEVDSLDTAKRLVGFGNSCLRPSLNSSLSDINKIRVMANSAYCNPEDGSGRELVAFYKAIRAEYSGHASSEEGKKLLTRLDWLIKLLSSPDRDEQ